MAIRKLIEIICDFCSNSVLSEASTFNGAELEYVRTKKGITSLGRHFCSNECCNNHVSFMKDIKVTKTQFKAFTKLKCSEGHNMDFITEGTKYINDIMGVDITEKEYEYILNNYSRLSSVKFK